MEHHTPPFKVAIARLKQHNDPPRSEPKRKARTQRACENCRKRKVRCTGEPQCRNCVDQGLSCAYSLARRDRLNEATEQNGRLVALLKGLSLHVDEEGQNMIHRYLDTIGDDEPAFASHSSLSASAQSSKRVREASPDPDQDRDPGPRAASISDQVDRKHLDVLDEDLLLTSKTRATGFVGMNSSIQWMRSLKRGVRSLQITASEPHAYSLDDDTLTKGKNTQNPNLRGYNNSQVSDSTFYLDCAGTELDEMTVNPSELPQPEVLDRLFECYMRTTHLSFPILPIMFQDQVRKFSGSLKIGRPFHPTDEWLAMLNLALAIGSQYSHLTQPGTSSDDHLPYMARATRLLRLDKIATSLPSPTLSFIQSIGLLSYLYLIVGQVSRAWMTIGIALRFALAAGLHLRNGDPSALPYKNEVLINTWWSLYSLESLLCAIIGRPCVISNDECTVPLPAFQLGNPVQDSSKIDTDATTIPSFLREWAQVALIMQKALRKLYSPVIKTDSWHVIQEDIIALMKELDGWAVHARVAGIYKNYTSDTRTKCNAQLLAFQYQSAKILICRPCLCRLEDHEESSEVLSELKRNAAGACVTAALAMTQLLPDQPDSLQSFYSQAPWFSIVHHIMQAMAVLLLKLSLGPSHTKHDGVSLDAKVKKLVRWLQFLSLTNQVAERAYRIVMEIIQMSVANGYFHVVFSPEQSSPSEASSSPVSTFLPTPGSTTVPTSPWQNSAYQDVGGERAYPPHQQGKAAVYPDAFTLPGQNTYNMGHNSAVAHPSVDPGAFQYPQIHMPPQNLVSGQDLTMPLYLGNPFYTYFDQSNSLYGDVLMNRNTFFDNPFWTFQNPELPNYSNA